MFSPERATAAGRSATAAAQSRCPPAMPDRSAGKAERAQGPRRAQRVMTRGRWRRGRTDWRDSLLHHQLRPHCAVRVDRRATRAWAFDAVRAFGGAALP